jgi:hypothetical protein
MPNRSALVVSRRIRDSADVLDAPVFTPPPILIRPGQEMRTVMVNVFRCPLCRNVFRYEDRYEPMCTGPGSQDSHAPEVMRFISVEPRRVQV